MRALRGILASVALVALASAGISGCAQHEAPMMAVPHVDLPLLRDIGLRQEWTRSIGLEPGERVQKAWRIGVSVYVATSYSRLVRINAKSGMLVWSNVLGEENFDIFQPVELKNADGSPATDVLVVTRGAAFVFNMQTGEQSQPPAQLGMSVLTDPIVIGNTLGVGGADGFYGMYMDRLGLRHWRIPSPGDLFDSTPAVLEDKILLASHSGRLWRVNADSGVWEWKDRKTNGDVLTGVVADYNAVYVPSMDQRVYAFRSDTGGELWERQLSGRLDTKPTLAGPCVLVISREEGMYAMARDTGEIKWHVPDVTAVAAIEDDAVWVGDSMGNLKLIALDNGAQRQSAPVPGVQIYIQNTTDNHVFLVAHDGTVAGYLPLTYGAANGNPGK